MALSALTDEIVAAARRRYRELCTRTESHAETWGVVAGELGVSLVALIKRCNPQLAANLSSPASRRPRKFSVTNAQQVIDPRPAAAFIAASVEALYELSQ